jgi:hypothetical protein
MLLGSVRAAWCHGGVIMNAEFLKTLMRSGAFVAMVIIGLSLRWPGSRLNVRRSRLFILYVLVASAVAGFTQIEAWPFSNWALVHTIQRPDLDRWELVGIDANGGGHRIDERVLEPFAPEEFHTWLRIHFFRMDPEGRQRIADFIVRRAEQARVRFLATGHVETIDRYLGPLTAPRHFHRGAIWRTSADVPNAPFVRLMIVRAFWDIETFAADPSALKREVLFESR